LTGVAGIGILALTAYERSTSIDPVEADALIRQQNPMVASAYCSRGITRQAGLTFACRISDSAGNTGIAWVDQPTEQTLSFNPSNVKWNPRPGEVPRANP
jgi:hypothetical protein